MRWKYEGVDFEPAGKEHSASGGSRDTGNELAEEIFDKQPPVHQMYEFVTKTVQRYLQVLEKTPLL